MILVIVSKIGKKPAVTFEEAIKEVESET